MMREKTLRHPKESTYFTLGAIVGGITWFGLIWLIFLFMSWTYSISVWQ